MSEYVDASEIARQVRVNIKAAQNAQQLDRDLRISVRTRRASLMSEVAVFIRGDKLTNRYLLRPIEERAEHGCWTPDALRIAGKVRELMGPAWAWEDGRGRFATLYFRDGLCAP